MRGIIDETKQLTNCHHRDHHRNKISPWRTHKREYAVPLLWHNNNDIPSRFCLLHLSITREGDTENGEMRIFIIVEQAESFLLAILTDCEKTLSESWLWPMSQSTSSKVTLTTHPCCCWQSRCPLVFCRCCCCCNCCCWWLSNNTFSSL